MTNATTHALELFLSSHSFTYLTTTISAIAIALLLLICVEREIVRITRPANLQRDLVAFSMVIFPLALVFAFVIISRFAKLS